MKEDIIAMAREAGWPSVALDNLPGTEDMHRLERFEALVRADERKSKPHSLGPGEMELSLKREHNGELFECRQRFSAMEVMRKLLGCSPAFMVGEEAARMNKEIDAAIRARKD
jgi:hypothetical protein